MEVGMRILAQVSAHIRTIIVRMAPYYQPGHDDQLHFAADTMTPEQVQSLLDGKAILSTENMLELADKLGLEGMMNDDFYVEPVVEYIMQHQADCEQLWARVRFLRDNPPF